MQQKRILKIFHMFDTFALKTYLANLKNEVDKLDTDKLKAVPTDCGTSIKLSSEDP